MMNSYFLLLFKGMDSEPHKTPYVYVKYHHKFIPGTRECISGLLRKIFVFKVGKPSFFPASERIAIFIGYGYRFIDNYTVNAVTSIKL